MRAYPLHPVPAPSFRIRYEEELNAEQLAVVTADTGPLLVIAGAGSGKTRAVTYRVARLIERGVDPARILLVTFTNKAAREMLHRVGALLTVDTRRLWGGTFHHIGNLILRRHAKLFGYAPNFGILDRDDSKSLLDECASDLQGRDRERRFPKGDVLLEILSFALNTGVAPADVIERQYPQFMADTDDLLRVFRAYAGRKVRNNAMDFDDLLVLWRRLLDEHPESARQWSERFQYILVDEYQDTNRVQGAIVDALASVHRNLMVVGDDAQSIYSFRGAHFANILGFPKRYPDAKVFRLETNYRSTPQILALANSSIAHNVDQFPKTLRAVRGDGETPGLAAARDGEEQARFVAQRILERHEDGVPLGGIAVLYRAHFQAMELQLELTRRNIPFEIRSGLRFFEQAHIKDVVAFLKLVENPRDELSWKRAIRLYPRLGKSAADKIWKHLAALTDPLAALGGEQVPKMLPRGAAAGWKAFAALVGRLAKPPVAGHPAEMIAAVLEGGYEQYVQASFENAAMRIEDIRQLANFALRFEDTAAFLSEMALLTDLAGRDAGGEDADERVVLSTVHQAKGLEWRVVFVIGLVDGSFPNSRGLREAGGEEEERRLFYVAVTRAKDELMLSYPLMAREGANYGLQRPSRFVKELAPGTFEEWRLTDGAPGGATEAGGPFAVGGASGPDLDDGLDPNRPRARRPWDDPAGGLVDSDPVYE